MTHVLHYLGEFVEGFGPGIAIAVAVKIGEWTFFNVTHLLP